MNEIKEGSHEREKESSVIFKRVLESVEIGRDYLLRKIIDFSMCEREFVECVVFVTNSYAIWCELFIREIRRM
jgi:hypothetical protein